MSTTLDVGSETATDSIISNNAVSRIRNEFVACRVKFKWFGTSRALSSDQRTKAAEIFGANESAISAAKRLIDTKDERYRSLTSCKSRINKFWRDSSLPYPEAGIRLIRNDAVDQFNSALTSLKQELEVSVSEFDSHFSDMKEAARVRLGSLFSSDDYPGSMVQAFDVSWDFPSVDAPEYLRRLSPDIYRRECERVQSQFSDAVQLAEQMFQDQLSELLEHLVERLASDETGKQKTFRDSTISNLNNFFSRFQQLSINSDDGLTQLVSQAQAVIGGIEPQRLRDNDSLRQRIATQMSAVQASLDGMMVDRPRRNILRKGR